MDNKINSELAKRIVEGKLEKAESAIELSKELFMLTGDINYYNLYKALENPKNLN